MNLPAMGHCGHVAPPEKREALVVSLTHVRVPRSMPVAAAVADYQKHWRLACGGRMRKADLATFASFGLVAAEIVMLVVSVGIGQAQSQTSDMQQPKSAAVMAVVINQGGFGATPLWPSFTFAGAAAYVNVVEVKYVTIDSALFSRMKIAGEVQLRRLRAAVYCTGARLAYLRRGITVREVFTTLDRGDRVDVSIDVSSCDDPKYGPERPLPFGCVAPLAHFSHCAPDDRKCEVASKMRGCVVDFPPRR